MKIHCIIEALLFTSHTPLNIKKIYEIVKEVYQDKNINITEENKEITKNIKEVINDLNEKYKKNENSFTIIEKKSGWLMCAKPEYSKYIEKMLPDDKPPTLSPAALETLAIVAYKKQITKNNLEDLRGVNCDGVINKLLEREMIKISGKLDILGKPLLYSVTQNFYDYFGIKNFNELPKLKEINQIKNNFINQVHTPRKISDKNTTHSKDNTNLDKTSDNIITEKEIFNLRENDQVATKK